MAFGTYKGVHYSLARAADPSPWRRTVHLATPAKPVAQAQKYWPLPEHSWLSIWVSSGPNLEGPRRSRLNCLVDGRSFCIRHT